MMCYRIKKKRKIYDTYGSCDEQNIPTFNSNHPHGSHFTYQNFDKNLNGDINMLFNNIFNSNNNFKTNKHKFNNNNEFIYPNGTKVQIINLKDRPHYNNLNGIIVNYNNKKSRYLLSISDDILSLRDKNLIPMYRNVKLINLGKKYYNNKTGNIISYNSITKRFNIELFIGGSISVKEENIIYKLGSIINIKNLITNSKYNNTIAKIVDFTNSRYIIKLKDNKILRINSKNISVRQN